MEILFAPVLTISIFGTIYAIFNYVKVKSLEEGTEKMSNIAQAIRTGANTFLVSEYKVLSIVLIILTILFATFISVSSSISFLIGAFMSGAAGLFGMKMSTYANVRVTNKARETKDIGKH